MMKKLLLPLLALALAGWSVWNVFGGQRDTDKGTPPEAPPRSPYKHALAGSGIVEPRTESSGTATVAVGSVLPGVVTKVVAHIGQRVQVGDPLFYLDDRDRQAELKVKQANLVAAQKQLERLEKSPRPEEVPPSEARVRQAREAVVKADDEARRARQLIIRRAISREELVQRQQTLAIAREKLAAAQTQHKLLLAGAWEPDKAIARAAVAQARAAVGQVKTDLDRLVVRAPSSGTVLQVNVRPGENVSGQPGQALVMMGDTSALHVRVSIDESDIARFRPQAAARALTRGTPQRDLPLKFVRLEPYVVPKKSLTGDNAERVDTRVMQAIYVIDLGKPPVLVGQQVDVFIDLGKGKETKKPVEKPSYPPAK
jgi:multidrug resistance efflux pump